MERLKRVQKEFMEKSDAYEGIHNEFVTAEQVRQVFVQAT